MWLIVARRNDHLRLFADKMWIPAGIEFARSARSSPGDPRFTSNGGSPMKVSEVMTKRVAHVGRREPLSSAARLMWECDCGAVPVVDEASGKVVGMITDRDICISTWSKDRAPSAIAISEAMSSELYQCSPTDNVSFAEALMKSKQIRRVPVVDEEQKLVGILSLADIATGARAGQMLDNELAPTQIAATLANICRRPASSTYAQQA
jgi:CBS domain-containing protein